MIIDMILDRKDGEQYDTQEFYEYMIRYENEAIIQAFESNDDEKIREAFKTYIDGSMFNPDIIDYVNSVKWSGKIKKVKWKKYWCCAWNNYKGEGFVYSRIITDKEINDAGGMWSWTDKNRCVLYTTEREAQSVLDYHYAD